MELKVALVLSGSVIAFVLGAVFYFIAAYVTVFWFGIKSEPVHMLEFLLCLAAGGFAAYLMLRSNWPEDPDSGSTYDE